MRERAHFLRLSEHLCRRVTLATGQAQARALVCLCACVGLGPVRKPSEATCWRRAYLRVGSTTWHTLLDPREQPDVTWSVGEVEARRCMPTRMRGVPNTSGGCGPSSRITPPIPRRGLSAASV